MAALTERRRADRHEMSLKLSSIAQGHGAEAEITHRGKEVTVTILHPSGLRCYVWLDGNSPQPDVHVIPWHIGSGNKRLAKSFGDVNPHHQQKATHIAHGWEALAAEIDRGLAAAADGSAYTAESAA